MQTPENLPIEKMAQDIREIELTHNNENKTEAQIKNILGADRKKYSKERLYNKNLQNICTNNTAYANYNKYGTKGFKLSPISTIYSDNIIVAGLIPIQEQPKEGEEESNNRFIKCYRNIIYNFLLANSIKDVKPKDIKLKGIRKSDGETGYIRPPSLKKVREFYEKFFDDIPVEDQKVKAQHFKIALANISYEQTLKLFNKDNLKELEENFIYVSDIDWTQDFKGSFNKHEIINYLLEHHNFRMQEDYTDVEYKDHTILKNDKTVGRNCLTFFYNNCRYKLYLKFVHSLELKSNTQQIGNNIREWVNNPEPRLRDTIKQSLDYGLTHAEITFYVNCLDLPTKEQIETNINYLFKLVPEI